MIKSTVKYLYDVCTGGFGRKSLKMFIQRYPNVEPFIRNMQVRLFDWYLVKPRIVQFRESPTPKTLFVDVSFFVLEDHKTGIQRVTRSILMELLKNPPPGFTVQAVYVDRHVGFKPATVTQHSASDLSVTRNSDANPIHVAPGDVFFGLDFACVTTLKEQAFLTKLKQAGVKVYFVIYDLLPIQFPQHFPPSHKGFHERWLRTLVKFDGVLCISKTIADDYRNWLKDNRISTAAEFDIDYFHLGADLNNSAPSKGMPADASVTLAKLATRPSFLMVGTLEPRKGYRHIVDAFSKLWLGGSDVSLVIVGKVGWNIDALVRTLKSHQELGKRLIWLQGVSDEYLERIYADSTVLIAASEGEGFGLPIIEAAQHGLPVILRDIPVFREVAGEAGFYFPGNKPEDTAECLKTWLQLYQAGNHPKSTSLSYQSWEQSVQQIRTALSLPQ
jgi:glycosyltransferase involved in cell wall biosynthesis